MGDLVVDMKMDAWEIGYNRVLASWMIDHLGILSLWLSGFVQF